MILSPELTRKCLELAGELPPVPHTVPIATPVNVPSVLVAAEFRLDCRVKSEANERCHWAVRHRRFKAHREQLLLAVANAGWQNLAGVPWWPFGFPATVTFTHCGQAMDDDNLSGAFKGLRDAVAEWAGVDDADPRLVWRYEQKWAGRKAAGVGVRIAKGV